MMRKECQDIIEGDIDHLMDKTEMIMMIEAGVALGEEVEVVIITDLIIQKIDLIRNKLNTFIKKHQEQEEGVNSEEEANTGEEENSLVEETIEVEESSEEEVNTEVEENSLIEETIGEEENIEVEVNLEEGVNIEEEEIIEEEETSEAETPLVIEHDFKYIHY